jgi:hypothetical protein
MIVDPDVIARGVSVAFELKNQNVAACQNPIVEGSLPVTVVNAYDVNGVSIASPTMGVSF